MKKAIFLLLFLPLGVLGQIFPRVVDFQKHIAHIKEVGYYSAFKKNGWKTITTFTSDSLPYNEVHFYKGEKRGNYYYRYVDQDTLFRIIRIDSSATNDGNYREQRIYFNSKKIVVKNENYWQPNLDNPGTIEEKIVRDSQNKILSYVRIFTSKSRRNGVPLYTTFNFNYNTKNQVISITQTDSEAISHIHYDFSYNSKGQISSITYDHNNPESVLSDIRPWSKSRPDKYRMLYKYDRFGNWKKKYFVTENGLYLDSKRTIKYK